MTEHPFSDGHSDCPDCEQCAREDWEEERRVFSLDGHPDDLMPPFACGWCGTMVGSNGAQVNLGGGTCAGCTPWEGLIALRDRVPIYLDPQGTPWHTLCLFDRHWLAELWAAR